MVWYMVSYHIISRLWAESTLTVTGVDSTLSAHVPLAHFLINHIIVIYIFTHDEYELFSMWTAV